MKNKIKTNKKGVSQIIGFMITLGLILLLIIITYIFLSDSASGIKGLITKIFG